MRDTRTEALFDDEPPVNAPIAPMAPERDLRLLGERLPAGIYLGSSSWNFPGWRGVVWSQMSSVKGLAEKGLTAYSAYPVFRTAGIDRSYYKPLTEETYRHFAEQVPDNFRFLVKAPQSVTDSLVRDVRGRGAGVNTHYLDVNETLETFIDPVVKGLGRKLGVLVFELAALPRERILNLRNAHAAIDEIVSFFARLPRETEGMPLSYGVEMRTAQLLTRRYIRLLRPTHARPVVGIHPSLPPVMRQINALRYLDDPENNSGNWRLKGDTVVRWSVAQGGTYAELKCEWAPFDRIQSPDIVTREAVAGLMQRAHASGVRGFTVANNKAEGCAPLTMRAVAESICAMEKTARDAAIEAASVRRLTGQGPKN